MGEGACHDDRGRARKLSVLSRHGAAHTIDMTVSFFVGTTLCSSGSPSRRGRLEEYLLWLGAFASAALAVLSKGLIAS